MEKLLIVLHHPDGPPRDAAARIQAFARAVEPHVRALTVHIADRPPEEARATLDQGAQEEEAGNLFDPTLYALLTAWIDTIDARAALLAAAEALPGTRSIHLATESAVRDYPVMDWPPGRPSPGRTLVGLFRRHPALDEAQFLARWAAHSVLSLRIHPLSRYLRNRVVETLAGEAWHGIVEERVADPDDFADDRFYIGEGARELAVRDISEFLDVENGMRCAFMTEIIFRPPCWLSVAPAPAAPSR